MKLSVLAFLAATALAAPKPSYDDQSVTSTPTPSTEAMPPYEQQPIPTPTPTVEEMPPYKQPPMSAPTTEAMPPPPPPPPPPMPSDSYETPDTTGPPSNPGECVKWEPGPGPGQWNGLTCAEFVITPESGCVRVEGNPNLPYPQCCPSASCPIPVPAEEPPIPVPPNAPPIPGLPDDDSYPEDEAGDGDDDDDDD